MFKRYFLRSRLDRTTFQVPKTSYRRLALFLVLTLLMALSAMAQAQSSLQFNGTNQYVTFGAATSTLGTQSFTLECWIWRAGTGTATSTGTGGINAVPLITKGRGEADGDNRDVNYFLGINGTTGSYGPANVLVADFEEGTGTTDPALNHPVCGVTAIANSVWYHAAVTYDSPSRRWRLYLNGNLEKDTVLAAGTRFPQYLSIQHAGLGTAFNSTGVQAGFFAGTLDEPRIWNYARTQLQIQQTINSEITSPQSGLLGRWGLNEGTGTIAYNTVTTGPNGTLVNTPVWTTGSPFNVPFTIPTAPSGLTATAMSAIQINLGWTDNSANEAAFEIERSTAGAGGPFTLRATVTANTVAYSDTGLTSVTPFWYRVRAVNGAGGSSYSEVATATTQSPAPPNPASGLTATAPSSYQMNLSWTSNSTNETAFEIWRSTDGGMIFSQLTSVPASTVSYSDNAVNSSAQYYYRVRATNGSGQSA